MTTNIRKQPKKKSRAQGMVEFALALPVLLLIVYGLLETGRLLFIYASTVTAARQAVRYGSATGDNGFGTPYYQDCDGIRNAAKRVGFIQQFEDNDIEIGYDNGPNDTVISTTCTGAVAVTNGDRIRVRVSTQWTPIVPLVPLKPFTIESESYRTILVSISISVTATASGGSSSSAGVSSISLAVSADPTTYSTVGQQITYTFTLTNTGNNYLFSPYEVIDANNKVTGITCSDPNDPMAPSAVKTCTGTYTVTQADLDAGTVVIQVTGKANAGGVSSTQVTNSVAAVQNKSLALTKVGNPDASSVAGTVITYTYTLTNTGNVTLTSPFAVSDNQISSVNCGSISTLAPLAVGTCTGTHTIKNSDITAGTIINTATATGKFGALTVTSNQVSFTVYTPPVYLTISASPLSVNQVGQIITYTYHLKNNTDTNMISAFTVADSRVTNESCAGAVSPLVPGATNNCTGSYTVTQADLNAGLPLTGTVTATAQQNPGNKTRTSNTVTTSIAVVQAPALTLTKAPLPTEAYQANTVVTYTFTLTNSGNVTLSAPYAVTDNKITAVSCPSTATLAPAASTTCSGTYTVTQSDLNQGFVTNTATATAKFGTQTITSSQQSATVPTYNGARLSLAKGANFAAVTGVGQVITYTYTLQNTGNAPLTAPYTVTDDKVTNVDCSLAVSPLPVGGSTTCTGSYTTVQADVDAGSVTNVATATAKHGTDTLTSNSATKNVIVNAP